MLQSLAIQAVFNGGNYTVTSSIIDNPLSPEGIQLDYIPFAYYAYRKAQKAAATAQFKQANIYKVLDGWTGIELCKIERYIDSNGKKRVRFFDFI